MKLNAYEKYISLILKLCFNAFEAHQNICQHSFMSKILIAFKDNISYVLMLYLLACKTNFMMIFKIRIVICVIVMLYP